MAPGLSTTIKIAKVMLIWNEEFATGSPLVDTQHRLLIEKINLFEQLLNGPPPSKAAIDGLIEFLGSYVTTHFNFEECCMAQHHCPVQEQNKAAHAAFLAVFGKFKERYLAEGPKPELLRSLQSAAAEWIKNHILTVDIKLKACINN
jgi:hemerythrin-like metal-binding protein